MLFILLYVVKLSFCFRSTGHVGVPVPCNVVKLVDVEEMNYFASNGEGEVSHSVAVSIQYHDF